MTRPTDGRLTIAKPHSVERRAVKINPLTVARKNVVLFRRTHRLSADPNITDQLWRKHPKIVTESDPPPVDLSVADIRLQITAERSEIAQWSQLRAYTESGNHYRSFEWYERWPLRPFLRENGSPKCTPRDMWNFEWPYLRNRSSDPLHFRSREGLGSADRMALLNFVVLSNPRWRPWHDMIEDIDKSRAMLLFVKLLWPLFHLQWKKVIEARSTCINLRSYFTLAVLANSREKTSSSSSAIIGKESHVTARC